MAGSAANDAAQVLTIGSPAKGWVLPLDAVPDPAFSSGALGDGLAIELLDPLICSPCDASVAAIATTGHAITLDLSRGAQILIHCGIDTVALGGSGFELLVEEGAQVGRGDPLMRIDLEAVASAGKSFATPIVLVEAGGYALRPVAASRIKEAGAPLFELVEAGDTSGGATTATGVADYSCERNVSLPLPHGLHARPSAAIAAEAAKWAGPITVVHGDKIADARSTTALMKLGASLGSELTIRAGGDDAEAAAEALAALIEAGAGDDIAAAPKQAAPTPTAVPVLRAQAEPLRDLGPGMVGGVAAAPGKVLGKAYYLHRAKLKVSEASQGQEFELERLSDALGQLRSQISGEASGSSGAIGAAHLAILDDPALLENVEQRIADGISAAVAWQGVMEEEAEGMRALPDPRLAERADDFADLEQQLLRILTGKDAQLVAPAGSVVIASDLYPSDLAPLAKAGITGIAMMAGGPTSHLAILAASAGIPMAVAFGKPLCEVEEDSWAYLDGDAGSLQHQLTEEQVSKLSGELERRAAAYKTALAAAQDDTHLASGERIEVFANLGSVADAEDAVAQGAEGSGLLRTEFLFLDRAEPPSEEEQAEIYGAIMDQFGNRPVIIRTLDIGADKPAPYLPLGHEDNPALGVRGIRVGLRYPDLLKGQIRAILRAAGDRTAHIMAPMVASVGELDTLRTMLDEIAQEVSHTAPVKLGAMVETPASALIAEALAQRADFLSVGTNDLTQYTLAVDRTNPDLAPMLDAMHPAVLRLIGNAGEACSGDACLLGVCGSAAGDHLAAAVLVGLGVSELSASAARIPELKQHLRSLTLDQCRDAARAAINSETPEQARAAAEAVLAAKDEG